MSYNSEKARQKRLWNSSSSSIITTPNSLIKEGITERNISRPPPNGLSIDPMGKKETSFVLPLSLNCCEQVNGSDKCNEKDLDLDVMSPRRT